VPPENFHERVHVKGEISRGRCPNFHSYSPGAETGRAAGNSSSTRRGTWGSCEAGPFSVRGLADQVFMAGLSLMHLISLTRLLLRTMFGGSDPSSLIRPPQPSP